MSMGMTMTRRERRIAGVVALAVTAYAVIIMASPATATHPGVHPTFRSERVYFHCQGPTKVQNANWFVNGPAPWDATPPSQSLDEGGGCGATSLADIASDAFGSDSNPDSPQAAVFRDTFVGNIETMTFELHNLLLSQVRPLVRIPQGPSMAPQYDVGIRISIDGKPLFPSFKRGVRVPVTPELSPNGLIEKLTFSVRFIGCAEEITDAAGNVIGVATDGVATDDGHGTTRHTIAVTVDQWFADRFAAWVWDATDAPAGITFNPDTLAKTKLNPEVKANCHVPVPGRTERVSVASDGTEATASSGSPAMDASGRYVAFSSAASDLVPGGSRDYTDIFVHDRETGVTEQVSVATDGTPANRAAFWPDISADGRFVAFYSWATNLVPNDGNSAYDVFVHDRETGVTERVSVASDGSEANARSDAAPSISADGRFVAFPSWATNLVPGDTDTNPGSDVFVHDRVTGVTERVSVATDGTQANGNNFDPDLSADGRMIAFLGYASNLVPGDTNGTADVFVRDLDAGVTERVSVASGGSEGDAGSWAPSITADGGLVAFQSQASNLVPADANGTYDVFIHDRGSGTTELVSLGRKGQGDDASLLPKITPAGRYVLFQSNAENLVASDTNLIADMFVRDRMRGVTERVSLNSSGKEITGGLLGSWVGAISADAQYIAFASDGLNVVPDDTNNAQDIFVRERDTSDGSPAPSPTDSTSPTPSSTTSPSPTECSEYPVEPNDPFFNFPLGFPLAYGIQWGPQKISAPEAWQEPQAVGCGIDVAILDTGADLTHEDLSCPGKLDVVAGSDVVSNDDSPQDENGHGSHVAGIVGACTNNGKGIVGVAPAAGIMPIRVLNEEGLGTDQQIIAGIDKAVAAGSEVINLSLGFGAPTGSDLFDFSEFDAAIERAAQAGVVIVAAAGNESFPLCAYPALAEDVICVGATDPRDQRSWYSTFANKARSGPSLVAPGGTGTVFCDVDSEDILSLWAKHLDEQQSEDDCDQRPGYENNAGTSMAAPHVSGTAALVYERLGGSRSTANAEKVIEALTSTAVDLGPPGRDPIYGSGRIDALAAVQSVEAAEPEPTTSPTSSTPPPREEEPSSEESDPAPENTGDGGASSSPTGPGSNSPSGLGSESASPPPESKGRASTTIASNRSVIRYWNGIQLTGVVERDPACSGSLEVDIRRRLHGKDSYLTIDTVPASNDGAWSVKLAPRRNASYVAVPKDTQTCEGAASNPTDVLVRVRIKVASPRSCTGGRRIRGSVAPNQAGTKVILERRQRRSWKRIDRDRLNDGSRFRLRTHRCGLYRVVWPQQGVANERTSARLRL